MIGRSLQPLLRLYKQGTMQKLTFIHLKRLYLHPRHADKLGAHANALSSAATVKISA